MHEKDFIQFIISVVARSDAICKRILALCSLCLCGIGGSHSMLSCIGRDNKSIPVCNLCRFGISKDDDLEASALLLYHRFVNLFLVSLSLVTLRSEPQQKRMQ